MGKILLLGDITQPRYHSLQEINPLIDPIREKHDLVVSEEYQEITKDYLRGFDLVMNYIDNWEDRGNEEAELALCDYVAEGGRILTLHCGIIVKSAARLLELHGGSFRGHEEYGLLRYKKSQEHFITKDMESFSIYEEPYEFDFNKHPQLELILEYERNGKTYPAAWTTKEGQGKLVYLAFGHDKNTFVEKSVLELILKSIDWLLQ
ncbi:MAG: ThuA domain-containing protein [Mobilitalea sp.]